MKGKITKRGIFRYPVPRRENSSGKQVQTHWTKEVPRLSKHSVQARVGASCVERIEDKCSFDQT